MTIYKRNCLIIFAVCCIVILLLLAARAKADDIEWYPAVYGTIRTTSGLGYENPGFGLLGEIQARYGWAEAKLSGAYNWQKKNNADSGNTYNIGGQFRGYFYKGFYGLGAIQWSGYNSEFSSHGDWKKSGINLGAGIGWSNPYIDLYSAYYAKDFGSPNNVSFLAFDTRFMILKNMWSMTSLGPEWFEQTPGDDRTGFFFIAGIGVRW